MKWRRLLELCTSPSPPGQRLPKAGLARRRARFEALENRKLFAADLAEVTTAELLSDKDAPEVVAFEVATLDAAELEAGEGREVLYRTLDVTAVAEDEVTEATLDAVAFDFDPAVDPKILMTMTFRGADALEEVDPLAKSDEVVGDVVNAVDETDLDVSIMSMTGAVDLSATSSPVDEVTDETIIDVPVTDEQLTDRDVIFYSLGSNPEVETTGIEDVLASEDVNGDGSVTPLDMLVLINALNSYGSIPISQVASIATEASQASNWDINSDGFVTPLDALLLTNYFNHGMLLDTVESSQDAFAPITATRIRNPEEDVALDDTPVDESAPLIEDESKDEFWASV